MDIIEIKQRLTLARVLNYYGLKPDKHLRLHCPFHEDKTPSMQVYYKTHTCYCFSANCKTHGKSIDVIDFILHKENCSKAAAIQKAIELLGGINEVPHQAPKSETSISSVIAISRANPTLSRTEVLQNMFTYFKNAVHNSKPAQEYIKQRGLDDVIITGTESKETFSQLQSSTSLKLKIDDNGKVAATGKAKTEADKKLLEATTDGNVIVQINATSSNFTDDKKWYIGGAYQGSTVGADGKTYTRQTVNPQMTKTIDGFYEAKKGVSVLHEVLESYIGGVESPGVGGPTFDKTTPEFKAYKNAHDKTEAIDPRHKAPNISQDPNTGHLYINRPHPQFPMLNAEKLINDLSK